MEKKRRYRFPILGSVTTFTCPYAAPLVLISSRWKFQSNLHMVQNQHTEIPLGLKTKNTMEIAILPLGCHTCPISNQGLGFAPYPTRGWATWGKGNFTSSDPKVATQSCTTKIDSVTPSITGLTWDQGQPGLGCQRLLQRFSPWKAPASCFLPSLLLLCPLFETAFPENQVWQNAGWSFSMPTLL